MGGNEHDVIEFMPFFSVQYHIASGRLQLEKLPYDSTEENHFVSAVGKVDNTLVSVLDLGVVLYDKQSKEES